MKKHLLRDANGIAKPILVVIVVLVLAGAGDDMQARLLAGRRLYARLCEHLAPAPAARLAAELSGAPRKALYGGNTG